MIAFEDIQQLKVWLIEHGVDCSSWGTSGTKSLEHLWHELNSGESQIQDNPPLRVIQVVNIILCKKNKILIETSQELQRSHTRKRGFPPAEKIKPGESPINAAIRGLKEELQLDSGDIEIESSSVTSRKLTQESQSYPGLLTQYIIYEVQAKDNKLPDKDFWTSENGPLDPIKKHYWSWKSLD